jgi:enoyl-CoA hydratase/carnithine racemase
MTVATSKIDETLLISIDRPPVNALDLDAIAELKQAFATAAREMPQGGVVLTGGGDVSRQVSIRAPLRATAVSSATPWCRRSRTWWLSCWR